MQRRRCSAPLHCSGNNVMNEAGDALSPLAGPSRSPRDAVHRYGQTLPLARAPQRPLSAPPMNAAGSFISQHRSASAARHRPDARCHAAGSYSRSGLCGSISEPFPDTRDNRIRLFRPAEVVRVFRVRTSRLEMPRDGDVLDVVATARARCCLNRSRLSHQLSTHDCPFEHTFGSKAA